MENTNVSKENIKNIKDVKDVNELKVKKELLKVEVVNSDKYVGSDWCATRS